jgi:hypothetical protein
MSIKIANTNFVSAKYGNDGSGVQENPSFPYATIGKAISVAISNTPSSGSFWTIQVESGNYFEDITLPGFVNLNANSYETVTIIGSATINGETVIENVILVSNNGPAILGNLPNGENLTIDNSDIFALYTTFVLNSTLINMSNGSLIITNSDLFLEVLPAGSNLTGIFTNTNFEIRSTDLTIISTATSDNIDPYIVQINNNNNNIVSRIDGGITSITNLGQSEAVIIFAVFNTVTTNASVSNYYITGHQVVINSGGSSIIDLTLVQAVGNVNFEMSSSLIDFSAIPFANQASVVGLRIYGTPGYSPTVQLIGLDWAGQQIPPAEGVFDNLSISGFDGNGSVTVSGGLNAKISKILSNYTVVPGDFTLLILTPNTTITLPNYGVSNGTPILPIFNFNNQVVNIKNISNGPVEIAGSLFDTRGINGASTNIVLEGNQSYSFQTDGNTWYLLDNIKKNKKKHSHNKKCCNQRHN